MSTLCCTPDPFPLTRTHQALAAAVQEEAAARRLYLSLARRMEAAGLGVAAHAFRFTAAQGKEHRDVLRGLLIHHGGQPLPEEPLLPPLPAEPTDLMRFAARMKHDTACRYPLNARTAEEDGYPRIAMALRRIAETEERHARRFQQYAEAMQDGSIFRAGERVGWLCLPCGQLRYGQDAPRCCPVCGGGQGNFIRSDFWPFRVE